VNHGLTLRVALADAPATAALPVRCPGQPGDPVL